MASRKAPLSKVLDLSFLLGMALTVAFYFFVTQEAMKDTMLARYTTEHAVEYVIVAFFIWGLADVGLRALGFPSEMLALRQNWLPARSGREPASHAAALLTQLQKKPRWLRESRMGQRLAQAIVYIKEQGSASELAAHLRYLAELDEEKTHGNYGLVRFICWVTPMLGFLGTVVHFGTALGGGEASEIGDKLPTLVAEMGTAFNTTTVALIAATTMMFCLFLCERTERGMLHTIDRRAERDLLHRFEQADADMGPYMIALEAANRANLNAMDSVLERQLEIWSGAFRALADEGQKRHHAEAALWEQAIERMQMQFEANETGHENRLLRILETMEVERDAHRTEMRTSVDQVAALQGDFVRLVASLSTLMESKGELVKLQAILSDNLRLLRETQQIDQALHGLSAAIHLLTARGHAPGIKENRAA